MSLLCLGTSLPPALAVEDCYSLSIPAESAEVKQLHPKGSSGCKPFCVSELMDAVLCSGDTDSSSDFEAIPTMRGLQFRDQPSPSRSAFDTPSASVVGRAASINSGDSSQFETPRAAGIGSGLPFGGRNPVQMQGAVFQVNHQPETCKGPGFKSFYCLYYLFLSASALLFVGPIRSLVIHNMSPLKQRIIIPTNALLGLGIQSLFHAHQPFYGCPFAITSC